ncbi:uncharacterized protein JN550_001807 [Neoarthrinium moseri]|uniref:uncharacterized protein n=1 Tax=Neoarthrinium moseri TaxID=1658444 RepID=UPI001FDC1CB1|nr:uncharacterized protein JN550_001807 [Neoarthrinium moseri]KAI1875521.1 hypothetical protein JN550_001807 [Neoarthrinium moseri]
MPATERITANEEVRRTPKEWGYKKVGYYGQVIFYHPVKCRDGTTKHPILGGLPKDWELCNGEDGFFYRNTRTQQKVRHRTVLKDDTTPSAPPPATAPAAPIAKHSTPPTPQEPTPQPAPKTLAGPAPSSRPPVPDTPTKTPTPPPPPGYLHVKSGLQIERNKVQNTALTLKYQRVKTLDAGDGQMGGMNGGVYAVRNKDNGVLCVEKNFKTHDRVLVKLAWKEIYFTKKVVHNTIVHYLDGFIQDNPFKATLYLEFCDCGSLEDIMVNAKARKKARKMDWDDFIPESFIWHAFRSLADALHYLQTGTSGLSRDLETNDTSTWKPIVHRDIKPANVMLRSRLTPGSTRPLHVLLTDLGMSDYATETAKGPPWDAFGTPEYHAPELCFDPAPDRKRSGVMAAPFTPKADVWAVAAIIHALCERDFLAHMDRRCQPVRSLRWLGRRAKKPVLTLNDQQIYSDRLEHCILLAGNPDPRERLDAVQLIPHLEEQHGEWCADDRWAEQVAVAGKLPDWSYKKSDLS